MFDARVYFVISDQNELQFQVFGEHITSAGAAGIFEGSEDSKQPGAQIHRS